MLLLLFWLLQTPASPVGQITRYLAPAMVTHADGKVVEVDSPTKLFAGDTLTTGLGGRLRVQLNDGSIFSLGSQARLTVLQHDARTQHTRLELRVGRVRIEAVRHEKPGPAFEIHSHWATITLPSGDMVVDDSNPTRTVVFAGSDGATVKGEKYSVQLGAGQMTTADSHGPTPPEPAKPSKEP